MTRNPIKLIAIVLAGVAPVAAQMYHQVNLVSDVSGLATITDPLLINPWGISFSPTSPFWVSNAGSSTSTLYAVTGGSTVSKVGLEVHTPTPPSGQAFNSSPGFVVSQGGGSGPATFLLAGLNGTIFGWNSNVPPPVSPSTQAILAATGTPSPVAYTGLALGNRAAGLFLYAANNIGGRIDVFDKNFTQVSRPGGFADPSLPAGALPFHNFKTRHRVYCMGSGPTPP